MINIILLFFNEYYFINIILLCFWSCKYNNNNFEDYDL